MRSSVRLCTALLAAAALTVPPSAAGEPATPPPVPAPAEAGDDRPPPVPVAPGDVLVLGVGGSEGYDLLLPAPPGTGGWARAARFLVKGLEADGWTGYACVTGSGRFAAVVFAPRQFANEPVLRDRGAFAATLDLRTGRRWAVPYRVALKHHTPGCGTGDEVAFLRHLGRDQEATEVLVADPARERVTRRTTVRGQLTGAAPARGGFVAASGRSVVLVSPAGKVTRLATAPGPVFDVHPAAGDTVDFLAVHPATTVTAYRTGGGRTSALATAPLGRLRFAPGRGGANRLAGAPDRVVDDRVPVLRAAGVPRAVSLDGSALVESVTTTTTTTTTDAPAEPSVGTVDTATGERVEGTVRTLAYDATGATGGDGGGFSAAANTTTPRCAVARNDYRIQVMQPLPAQVEWAAHRAVRGELTTPRPPNWNNNGLGAYSPQGEFPRLGLTGGGRVPVQVLLGILAQESNLKQASYHALPGVPGNPLVSDYYGVVYDSAGRIVGMDYDKADCGYGIAQVTDHMTAADPYFTPERKKMIATDYAANMAAGLRILEEKWNQAKPVVVANDGNPARIENWYFAIWGYNTGVYPASGTNPYGVGWTNNPANADYPLDRQPFLRATYEDAAHPGDWPYQERVLGWAERAQLDYKGNPAYFDIPAQLLLPLNKFTFCEMAVNQCSSTYVNTADPLKSYCTRADRKCWWHGQKAWVSPPSSGTGEYAQTYQQGAPEPVTSNPHPPACTGFESEVPMSVVPPVLPPNAVVVDDVPDSAWNIVGCPGRTSAGTFALTYGSLAHVDFHQIGAGLGGHFWFAHVIDPARTTHKVTGTWTPPLGVTGWQRVLVHVPNHGADTFQADYTVWTGVKSHHRVVNQRWNKNVWVDLGSFNLLPGAKVSLTNGTYGDHRVDKAIDVAFDAVAFVPSAKPAVSYVAFGDSYSAGEGVEPYFPNSDVGKNTPEYKNKCHRSTKAYPVLFYERLRLQRPGVTEFHFQACSGAELPDVTGADQRHHEVPQLQQGWLDENTTHVSISIGGNDSGFGDIIKGCIMTIYKCTNPDYHLTRDGVVDPEPLVTYEPKVIDALRPQIVLAVQSIRNLAPNAVVTLVSYPHVVWAEGNGTGLGCDALDLEVLRWFDQTSDRLVNLMRDVATQTGAAFADPRAEFEDHEACTPVDEEWINAAVLYSSTGSGLDKPGSGSFHPKATGQEAYTRVVDAVTP